MKHFLDENEATELLSTYIGRPVKLAFDERDISEISFETTSFTVKINNLLVTTHGFSDSDSLRLDGSEDIETVGECAFGPGAEKYGPGGAINNLLAKLTNCQRVEVEDYATDDKFVLEPMPIDFLRPEAGKFEPPSGTFEPPSGSFEPPGAWEP